jgi:hypothetical protein
MRLIAFRVLGIAGTVCVALAASSCKSSSDDSSSTTTQSATGVWSGTDSVSGDGVTAIIDSGGASAFIRSDGLLFTGPTQVSASTVAVQVDGFSNFPATFSDGSTYGIGTLDGTVTSASTLAVALTFTTNGNTAMTGNWSLTYETLSNNSSSAGTIAGTYTDAVTGGVITISSAGAMSSPTDSNNCALTGSVSTGDTTHPIYEIAYTYSNCTGSYQVLNGVQFTGLAYLNPSGASPAQIVMAVTGAGAATTDNYGLVHALNAS